MTDTIDTDQTSTEERAAGTLAHLDPRSLDVGDNVREFANLTREFLDSIREHGVLVPLTALRRHDGVVEVATASAAPSLENCRVVSGVVGPCRGRCGDNLAGLGQSWRPLTAYLLSFERPSVPGVEGLGLSSTALVLNLDHPLSVAR